MKYLGVGSFVRIKVFGKGPSSILPIRNKTSFLKLGIAQNSLETLDIYNIESIGPLSNHSIVVLDLNY
jgi:Leucine-rich repeat (LRR) protein